MRAHPSSRGAARPGGDVSLSPHPSSIKKTAQNVLLELAGGLGLWVLPSPPSEGQECSPESSGKSWFLIGGKLGTNPAENRNSNWSLLRSKGFLHVARHG